MNHIRLGMMWRWRGVRRRMMIWVSMIYWLSVIWLFMVHGFWMVMLLVVDWFWIAMFGIVHWFLMISGVTAILRLLVMVLWFIGVAKSWSVMRIFGLQLNIDVGSDLNAGAARVIGLIMWVLVVVVEWRSTVVHFWLVIGLRVPVRRPVSVFVRWFMVRLRLIVWVWFMIWCRFMISWSWVVIRVRLSIMFNLVAVMGSLQGDVVVSFVLVMVASWRRRRWRGRWWWRWRRRMVWLHMVLFGIMMTWLVVAMTMTMSMILMNKDRGGSIRIVVVQRIIHCDHLVMMERLLNVMDWWHQWYNLLLDHSLHHCHRFAIVGILDEVVVIIVLVVVFIIIDNGYCSRTRGDDQGLRCQLISRPLSFLLSQCSKPT